MTKTKNNVDAAIKRFFRGFRGTGSITGIIFVVAIIGAILVQVELSEGFFYGFAAGFFTYTALGEILIYRERQKDNVEG